ncbi:unnamed protein product, partial [Sphacelaria rigidula]
WHSVLSEAEAVERLRAEKAGGGKLVHYPRPPQHRLQLRIPVLHLDMDSVQFHELMDIYKNVLMARLPTPDLRAMNRDRRRRMRSEGCIPAQEVLDDHVWKEWKDKREKDPAVDVGTKSGRTFLKELLDRTPKWWNFGGKEGAKQITRFELWVGKITWNMVLGTRGGAGKSEELEIGL